MKVYYPAQPASDGTTMTPPANAPFTVHELTDTTFSNPLPLQTLAGTNAAPLTTTAQGVLPDVYVISDNYSHIFRSGQWQFRRDSFDGAQKATEAAKQDASTARASAVQAASAAQEAVGLAKAPTDESVDAGIQRADLPGQVTREVAQAIAADETVAEAARAAIQSAGLESGFVSGEESPADEFTVSFDDGDPFIRANEEKGIHDTLIGGMFFEELPDDSGYISAVSERDPETGLTRLIWGKRLDGTEYPGSPPAVPGGDGTATKYRAANETVARNIVSGPAITLCGHSMAAGMFGELQAALPGVTVINNAVGGETSRTIAWRQGGQPITLLPSGGAIPASGPVTVTLSYEDGPPKLNGDWPMLQGANSYPGFLFVNGQKVPGTFSVTRSPNAAAATHHVDDTYQFTRTTAGSVIVANRPAPFYTAASEAQRGNIFVYWVGRNNYAQTDQVLSDVQAMIQHQTGLEKRFLIISEHTGEYPSEYAGGSGAAGIRKLNAEYRKLAGRKSINSLDYMISYGLQDAGITPTAGDSTDITNEVIPRSLRADGLHLTSAGDGVIAALIKSRLQEQGWI